MECNEWDSGGTAVHCRLTSAGLQSGDGINPVSKGDAVTGAEIEFSHAALGEVVVVMGVHVESSLSSRGVV